MFGFKNISRPFLRRLVGVLLAACAVSSTVRANNAAAGLNHDETNEQSDNTVIVAFIKLPPFINSATGGEPTGSWIDYTKALLKEAGLTPRFVIAPVSRLYSRIARGDFHVSIAAGNNKNILEYALFCPEPVARLKINLYGLPNDTPPKLANLSDAAIITLQGYQYAGLYRQIEKLKGVNVLATPNREAAYLMLFAKRGRYILDYEVPSRDITQRLKLPDLAVTNVSDIKHYVVVSKNAPNAGKLHRLLTDTITRMPMTAMQPPAVQP